jgi:hypothetical protein
VITIVHDVIVSPPALSRQRSQSPAMVTGSPSRRVK